MMLIRFLICIVAISPSLLLSSAAKTGEETAIPAGLKIPDYGEGCDGWDIQLRMRPLSASQKRRLDIGCYIGTLIYPAYHLDDMDASAAAAYQDKWNDAKAAGILPENCFIHSVQLAVKRREEMIANPSRRLLGSAIAGGWLIGKAVGLCELARNEILTIVQREQDAQVEKPSRQRKK